MAISLSADCLLIDGQPVPVYSGTLHYWRLERERWPAILDQVRALGFRMVETYIPWSVHEVAPGRFDWGADDPRKDVEAFLRLCEERGIWLLARPGPLINAELTDFGFPEWVLLDEAVQARTALGGPHLDAAWGFHPPRPFPVPSYASEAFYRYVGGWFDAVVPILARHLAPRGCVAAVQSDNETCYLFHDQPYATDYSPGSLALYRRFLAARYGEIGRLNAAYAAAHPGFEAVEPPRDCEVETRADLPRHLDWVAYKEHQITYAVSRCAAMLRERGVAGVPIFHDVAYQYTTPLDITEMEADPQIDWVGINLYRNKEGYRGAVRQIRYQAGTTALPFVPEFGAGLWSHHPQTPMPDDQELITLGALAHGLKAINFYMLVERERWQASPITRHGELRPGYAELYRRLSALLESHRLWEWRRAPAALALRSYDLGRYSALASTLHYAHADLYGLPAELFRVDLDLGLAHDPAAEADEDGPASWMGGLLRALEARGLDYDLSDSHAPLERLSRYPLVFLQSVDFLDAADQARMLEFVSGGGTLVLGPALPTLDPQLRPCDLLARHLAGPGEARVGQGRLIWAAADGLPAIVAGLAPPPFRADNPALDVVAHTRGAETLLFTLNPTDRPIASRLRFDGRRRLRPIWRAGVELAGAGEVELELPAYAAQIWEVLP